VAIYRLSVQGIRRSEGRSTIAAAAYRSGTLLRDERLEMAFDFRKKEGIEHREIMAPEGTPAALLEREALWNAAEKSERRIDAVPAQEILIALPHELNTEQRRELVRAFVRESLVSRGMIVDFNIHQPDPQGDQRNFHAHILVTTRDVGPEGFGPKNRDWHHQSFVADVRHEWARIQNRELQRYLGKDAPTLSEKSLAEQGISRIPSPKLGPAATAMERRGERSENGTRREATRLKQRETERKDRDLERQMRPEHTAWTARRTDDLVREMAAFRAQMLEQRALLVARRDGQKVPRPPSTKQLENALTKAELIAHRRAQKALSKAQEQALASGISPRQIALWFVNPGAAFMSAIKGAHRVLDRLETADRAARAAETALNAKRVWVRSEPGQAQIANLREPAVQAAVDAAKVRRSAERRIRRLDARVKRVNGVIRNLSVARELNITQLKVPPRVPTDQRFDANQERRLRAIGRPAAAAIADVPKPLYQALLGRIRARALEPPRPTRGPEIDR
jgi:hypothetical protein